MTGRRSASYARAVAGPTLDDERLRRELDAARDEESPERIAALADAWALTPSQLRAVGVALVELNDELGDDAVDPAPILLCAAAGLGGPYTFACGDSTYTLDGARPWSLDDAIEFAGAGPHGLELREPVELTLPWPQATARRIALEFAGDLLRRLAFACEEATHERLTATLAEICRAHALADVAALAGLRCDLEVLRAGVANNASEASEAAEAAETDPALNERAYALAGAEVAIDVVLTAASPSVDARLGELFELRRAAIYPLHAMEHDRERWYSLVMAQYDELMTGDFVAEEVWDRVGELLRDVVRGLIAAGRGSAQ